MMKNILTALLCLGLTTACATAQSPEEASWQSWVAGNQAGYTAAPHAVLKVNDAIYLKPGQTAFLLGEPSDASSYVWTLDPETRETVLSVDFDLDPDGTPLVIMRRGGEQLDFDAVLREFDRYPINDQIDLDTRPSGLDTDDPRYALLIYNQDHQAAASFNGLSHFPYDPDLRIETEFTATVPPQKRVMQTERGLVKNFYEIGRAHFSLGAVDVALPLYGSSADTDSLRYFFALFTDATTGRETYAVGRYMDIKAEGAFPPDTLTVDFNYAYNPLCAYSAHFNCPVVEFDIPAPIRAGARYEGEVGDR